MIAVNDNIPAVTLKVFGENGPEDITTEALFADKKVVLFAVPGAFTPGCSQTHLPGYVVNADNIKAKGVDSIICLSVNDAFVMNAWGKAQNAEALIMLADGSGELTKALGLEKDITAGGMGIRSQRYAMIVENGKVTSLNVEPARGVVVSAAEAILELL
ncbi:MAG: peroxiredoxin [Psychrosphaera sp.]|nr:peroxiredoxin [Psychrosphaera sp.]